MRSFSLLAAALAGLIAVPTLAQDPPPDGTPTRIRGTVEKLDGSTLVVKSRDGSSVTITLAEKVAVAVLVKKSLADIKPGDYVASTAVKGTDGKLHSVEVRIFPEAQRGVGEGQRPWDLTPDSVMTNATVGTITQATSGQSAACHLQRRRIRADRRAGMPGAGECRRRYEPVEARRGSLRHRLEEPRRHRDLRPALCRKGRHQAADVMVAPLYQLERH